MTIHHQFLSRSSPPFKQEIVGILLLLVKLGGDLLELFEYMAKLPSFLKSYFWEIDFNKLDPKEDHVYIIKRLLDYGDLKAAKWVYQNFSKEKIEKVITKSRGLSPKTAAFWANLLRIPERQVVCLQELYRKRLKAHWVY